MMFDFVFNELGYLSNRQVFSCSSQHLSESVALQPLFLLQHEMVNAPNKTERYPLKGQISSLFKYVLHRTCTNCFQPLSGI